MASMVGGFLLPISTRAPTGGATHVAVHGLLQINDFYSRPHGRGDTADVLSRGFGCISTRAPTGGAT